MGFIPVSNVMQLDLVYSIGTGVAENVLYFQASSTITEAQLEDATAGLASWWHTQLRSLTSQSVSLIRVLGRDLTEQDGIFYEYAVTPADPGTDPSPILPMNVTCAIKHNTGRAGRSFRGRTYFVGLCEAQVTGDGINSQVVTGLLAAFSVMKSEMSTRSLAHVVVSRYSNHLPRTAGVATPVTSYTMDAVVDSQRRRLSGRGI